MCPDKTNTDSNRLPVHIRAILERLALRAPDHGRRLRKAAIHNAAKWERLTSGMVAFMLGELKVQDLI